MNLGHHRRSVAPRALAVLSLLALGALTPACSSRLDTEQTTVSSTALTLDGAAPGGTEYSIYAVPTLSLVPVARRQAAMSFDAGTNRAVVFGGTGSGVGTLAETWEYDGTWARACDPGACGALPPRRFAASMAYAPTRGVNVLFGGTSSDPLPLCDTWEWSSQSKTWTPASEPDCNAQGAPPRRAAHAMTGFGSKAVLFGGYAASSGAALARSNDLMAWDGQSWTSLCTGACASGSVPAPRTYATLVHVPAAQGDGVLLVYGGEGLVGGSGAVLADLWKFDLATSTWSELCTSSACRATAPAGRERHVGVFDTVRGKLFVHGGCKDASCTAMHTDAYEYDLAKGAWAAAPPPILPGLPEGKFDAGAVFDPARRRVVEYGGHTGVNYVANVVEYYTRGGACTSNAECHTGACQKVATAPAGICVEPCTGSGPTGACVSGYACDAACDTPCQTCARVPGVCTAITVGTDDEAGLSTASQCKSGHTCAPGTDLAGACKLDKGESCTVGPECASGVCSAQAPQTCVDEVCNQPCEAPQAGECVARGRGAEPSGTGCGGLRCGDDGACLAKCTGNADCVPDQYCDLSAGKCRQTKEPGEACTASTDCKIPNCVDGVCCASACNGSCEECGSDGTCRLRPDGTQPREGHVPCLGTGVCGGHCGGARDCVQPNASTACAPEATCTQRDFLQGSGACNGQGSCTAPGAPTSCGAFSCDESAADCYRECNGDAQCRRGATCKIASDGHGVCNDEGVVCAESGFALATPRGIVDCDGYPCVFNACAFKGCTQGRAGDCAPTHECTEDHLCVPVVTVDAGATAPDGGIPKRGAPRTVDAGRDGGSQANLGGGGSSCAVSRASVGASRNVALALAALGLAVLRKRRRTGATLSSRA